LNHLINNIFIIQNIVFQPTSQKKKKKAFLTNWFCIICDNHALQGFFTFINEDWLIRNFSLENIY